MSVILSIKQLSKTYASGLQALKPLDLEVQRGEILALLGPNGAGKTTLIGLVCGLLNPSAGTVSVDGHDIHRDFRAARARIGLVPQELATEMFESPLAAMRLSRGLFGCAPDEALIERLLRDLSLWEKRNDRIQTLSGGMKRRVMIAKALAHEPALLFLDEPTAGVDVELRRDMWALVRQLRKRGTTVILTTHYIEEAEEMADRIGVLNRGELILVEDKARLMSKLGSRRLTLQLSERLEAVPAALAGWNLSLAAGGHEMNFQFDTHDEQSGIPALLRRLDEQGIRFRDLHTSESSLEDIFVDLVHERVELRP